MTFLTSHLFPSIYLSLSLFHFGIVRYLINGEEEHTYFKALTGNRMGKGE